MGEYIRDGPNVTLRNNLGTIMGAAAGRTKITENHWIECFRIVDTVLTKVIQVQRLHMNLICEFVQRPVFYEFGYSVQLISQMEN